MSLTRAAFWVAQRFSAALNSPEENCHPERDAFCLAKDLGAPRDSPAFFAGNNSRVLRASLITLITLYFPVYKSGNSRRKFATFGASLNIMYGSFG